MNLTYAIFKVYVIFLKSGRIIEHRVPMVSYPRDHFYTTPWLASGLHKETEWEQLRVAVCLF